jgi:hypothetical protein
MITKKIIVIFLLISIILILYIKQLKQKEHLTLTNDEKLSNIVGIFTNNNINNIIGSEASFDKIAANTFDLTDLINTNDTKNNYINNIKTNFLDVNNINANTGTINTINSQNIQGNPDNMNGTFQNIYLENLPLNKNIYRNNINLNNLNTENTTVNNLNIKDISANNANVSNLTSSNFNSNMLNNNNGTFNTVNSQNLTNINLSGNKAFFTRILRNPNIRVNNLNIKDISANNANFSNLTSSNFNSNMLNNNNGTFNTVNSQNLTNNKLVGNIGTFNRINATNINMNNNSPTNLSGKFNNINVTNLNSNNFIGNTNTLNNLISRDISSNFINGNNGNFNTIISRNSPMVDNINIDKSINQEMCFSPTKCFTKNTNILLNRMTNPVNNYMYLPNSPGKIDNNIIWDNIRNEINPNNQTNGALKAVNDTWDLYYNVTKLYNKNIYKTTSGSNYQSDGIGIEITIPPRTADMSGDFTVLWVQTLNDYTPIPTPATPSNTSNARWSCFKVYDYTDPSNIRYFGKHVTGGNLLNNMSPNGSTSNVQHNAFSWWPVPIDLSGNTSRKIMISCFLNASSTTSTMATHYSGFAFSTNPWNHCPVNARSLFWQINEIDPLTGQAITGIRPVQSSVEWIADFWNGRQLMIFKWNTRTEFRIPFVNNQKNKIFYLIEHNNDWGPPISSLEIAHQTSWINLGNFYTTFNNPFSKYNNSKLYNRYYGIVIPKEYLPTKGTPIDNFIRLRISLPVNEGLGLYIREVGTHDLSPF